MAAVIILLVVAVGAFAATQRSSSEDTANIEDDEQIIPVRRGDLIKEISITAVSACRTGKRSRSDRPG